MPATCAGEERLLQFPPVSTKAKLLSCEAKQIPLEPKTAQDKQVWRAKQGAFPSKALGEVEAQPRLSREDKGKTPLSVRSIAHASREDELEPWWREFPLASPNQRALVSSAKSAPLSKVKGVSLGTDSVAYATSAPKGANKVPSHEARTKALSSANYLHRNAKNKAPFRAKSEVTTTSLPMPSGSKFALGGGSTSFALSSEANTIGEVVLKSLVVKKRSFNARVLQHEQLSTWFPRVSILELG